MLYLSAEGQSVAANTAAQYAYTYAKRYAQSIPVWELGNELDGDRAHADVNTAQMRDMAAGVQQAAAETGVVLKTAINIMATCNDSDPCDTNGDFWFLDTAVNNGFNFDIVTLHYYSRLTDGTYRHDVFLGQARQAAERYGVKVFLNEANCAEIYDGDDGNSDTCAQSFAALLNEVKTNYSDVIDEVDAYELLDESNRQVGGFFLWSCAGRGTWVRLLGRSSALQSP